MTRMLRRPDTLPDPASLPLVLLQGAAESTFLEAGRNLEATVDELHALRGQFDRLHHALGPDRSAEFHARIEAVNRQMTRLRADLALFGGSADSLHGAILGIRSEVAALYRVMRTIAIVSINARIQGNGLVPARPQVTAFIRQLGVMSDAADVILREVGDTMTAALEEIAALGVQHQDMLQGLHRDLLPEIARFSQMSERMRDGQAALQADAQEMASEMAILFADVSRLVVALQIGDATRQRLERAEDTIGRSQGADPALAALLTDLARRLIDGARADASAEVEAAIATLAEVKDRAQLAMQSAARSALGQSGQGGRKAADTSTGALEGHLAGSQARFAALRARTGHIHDLLDSILRHEPALRQIAHEIRLAGINAIITCAKLGHEGRTLRELAHWLRGLTDESDAIVLSLQGILAASQAIIRTVGEDRIGGIDQSLSVFLEEARPLGRMMQETAAEVQATSQAFGATTRRLPDRIVAVRAGLAAFLAQTKELDDCLAWLTARQAGLPPPALPGSSEAEALIADLDARYTMAQERRIHDLWDQTLRGEEPTPPAEAPEDAAEDDVFF